MAQPPQFNVCDSCGKEANVIQELQFTFEIRWTLICPDCKVMWPVVERDSWRPMKERKAVRGGNISTINIGYKPVKEIIFSEIQLLHREKQEDQTLTTSLCWHWWKQEHPETLDWKESDWFLVLRDKIDPIKPNLAKLVRNYQGHYLWSVHEFGDPDHALPIPILPLEHYPYYIPLKEFYTLAGFDE